MMDQERGALVEIKAVLRRVRKRPKPGTPQLFPEEALTLIGEIVEVEPGEADVEAGAAGIQLKVSKEWRRSWRQSSDPAVHKLLDDIETLEAALARADGVELNDPRFMGLMERLDDLAGDPDADTDTDP